MNDCKCDSYSVAKCKNNYALSSRDCKITTLNLCESSIKPNYDVDKFKIEILEQVLSISKLIQSLSNRIKKLEESAILRELAGNLNKHYEQSRCSKRTS